MRVSIIIIDLGKIAKIDDLLNFFRILIEVIETATGFLRIY